MRKEFREPLLQEIGSLMNERLNGFESYSPRIGKADKGRSMMARGGEYFRREDSGGGLLFLAFWTLSRADTLMLDIGWSAKGRFPFDVERPSMWSLPESPATVPEEGWIEFGALYHHRHNTAWLGWQLWECSVKPDHPDYRKIFVEESLRPVSPTGAQSQVALVVQEVAEALAEFLPLLPLPKPYFKDSYTKHLTH